MVHVVSVKASRRTQKDDDGWNRFYTTYEAVVRAGKVRYQISCVDILYLNTKNEQTRHSVCDKRPLDNDCRAPREVENQNRTSGPTTTSP